MNRDKNQKEKRAVFVKKIINRSSKPVGETVTKLSNRLFLAESTIWNDYATK